jgi:hypothetical protein
MGTFEMNASCRSISCPVHTGLPNQVNTEKIIAGLKPKTEGSTTASIFLNGKIDCASFCLIFWIDVSGEK